MNSCFRAFVSGVLLFTLVACGGGGSLERDTGGNTGGGGGSTTDPTISVTLTIADDSGQSDNQLSSDNPLTITATLRDSDGNVFADRLITFTFSQDSLATFNNDTGTALTNDQGVATIGLLIGTTSGDGLVTATVEIDGQNYTGQVGFSSTADPTLVLTLAITDDAGQTSNQLSSENPLTLTATVTDTGGAVVPDTLVTFTFNQSGLATFDNDAGTALTDAQGNAVIGLIVGPDSGDGLVTASVPQGTGTLTAQIGFSSDGITQTPVEPASLEFFASSIQLASSGSDQIELVALVKNDQNVLLEGIAVSFAANADAELQITQGTTAADGTARAILSSTTNPQNRTITASVSAGTLNQTLDIDVVGTEVNLSGPSSVIINDPVPLTIIVADSDGNGIANQAIELEVSDGTLDNFFPVSGATGQVTVNYTATSSGDQVITARSLNAEGTFTVTVQEDEFSFTTLPTDDVPLSEDTNISVTWLKEGVPFSGGTVTFTSSRGTIASPVAVTGADGVATIVIQSADAGIASISAEGVDGDSNVVSARTQIEFIATEPATLILDASPDSIGPDGQTSTISAVVRDAAGNLVKGQTVNFSVIDITGGFLSPNSAITDSSGIASTVYTSNVVSSQDSVVVNAEVALDTSITDSTTITVGDRAFDITLGTGREIQIPDNATYLKEFAAFVSDADSNPVPNAVLTASSTPVKFVNGGVYRKGFWQWDPITEIWFTVTTATCANEDINGNGSLDEGEDTNGDGFLTPGNIAISSNEIVTDQNGQATIEIRYPKQFGAWADIELRVSGQSAGSEAVQSQDFSLTVAAEDVQDEASPPPVNPFGSSAVCTDAL